jgi:hypothetical protein
LDFVGFVLESGSDVASNERFGRLVLFRPLASKTDFDEGSIRGLEVFGGRWTRGTSPRNHLLEVRGPIVVDEDRDLEGVAFHRDCLRRHIERLMIAA